METRILKDNWKFTRLVNQTEFETSLPASAYSILYENGIIENPYFKDNEDKLHDLMEEDFKFTLDFNVSPQFRNCDMVILSFEGIDTSAHISLNSQKLADVCNMHRTWRFDVTSLLEDDNNLEVVFDSPFRIAKESWDKCPTRGSEDAWEGFSNIRKAHYMYGWDWGAHLPDVGFFRDVKLIAVSKASIDSFYITQNHSDGLVELAIDPTFNSPFSNKEFEDLSLVELNAMSDSEKFNYVVTVVAPDGSYFSVDDSPSMVSITSPQLWWPNGLGDQPLYQIRLDLYDKDDVLIDSQIKRIGLRTMTMHIEKDEFGTSFAHEVNGQTFFAMGGDYIPEQHIIPWKTREMTVQLLNDCKLANFNSIRVWGGGYYPDDFFFDMCDELGLVIWQDFMFCCSAYELTPEFESNIVPEFVDNIKRIRHHASLGLWCGNNEMESFTKDGEWISKESEKRDYLFMYERIIPSVLKQYDPNTFYWPSSPSSGGSFDDPQDPTRGDVHFWQVWHSSKPFTEYRKYNFRYLSEFGFQSLPSVKTFEEGISDDPADMNLFSYNTEKHQRNQAANGKIMLYLQKTYKYPYNFSDMVYASQLLQGDGIRYGVEHFRRIRGCCMGAVYWQLNDCWPVISWSSIDYYGRWKALHYYAKRFFEPVHISCEEQGWVSASQPDFNRIHFDEMEKSIRLNITNETRDTIKGIVHWALRNTDSSIIREESTPVTVDPFSAKWMDKVLLPEADLRNNYVSFQLIDEATKEVISDGTVIFGLPKYFNYSDPKLTASVNGDEITITAKAYAASVEILNDKEDLVLSDNYFDMNAGSKTVKILRGDASSLRLRCVADIGR